MNLKRRKKIVSLHNKVNKKRTKENRGILQKKLKELKGKEKLEETLLFFIDLELFRYPLSIRNKTYMKE